VIGSWSPLAIFANQSSAVSEDPSRPGEPGPDGRGDLVGRRLRGLLGGFVQERRELLLQGSSVLTGPDFKRRERLRGDITNEDVGHIDSKGNACKMLACLDYLAAAALLEGVHTAGARQAQLPPPCGLTDWATARRAPRGAFLRPWQRWTRVATIRRLLEAASYSGLATSVPNAARSRTARSARTLRFRVMPRAFSEAMNTE
jgi:hypothetical protein